ncbi:MAG TPA: hypothetical protein VG897_01220, partial [Terriglobales bacterium]|nr:hypothetical protein [Terriglobales bacterium]
MLQRSKAAFHRGDLGTRQRRRKRVKLSDDAIHPPAALASPAAQSPTEREDPTDGARAGGRLRRVRPEAAHQTVPDAENNRIGGRSLVGVALDL